MIPLAEAQTFVLESVAPLPILDTPLDEALGWVLGDAVHAVTVD